MKPSFSISVPIGAYHPLLPACLSSLANQKAELYVSLLDASGDRRVAELADSYAGLFAYRRHGPDGGQSDAIAEGWENTPGVVLGWLNADDLLMPDTLARVTAEFEKDPDLDVVCGQSVIIDEKGALTGYHFALAPPGPSLLHSANISQPSCLFRRDAYDRAGGLDKSLHYVMDWDLWVRLYKSGAKFGWIDEPLSMVYWGAGTKTASFAKPRRSEIQNMLRTHAPPELQSRKLLSFAIHGITESLRPPWFRKAVLRRLRRYAPIVYGIGADGTIHDGARLYLAHYAPEPKQGMMIHLTGASERLSVSSKDVEMRTRAAPDGLEITFADPVPPAKTIVLNCSVKDGPRLYLERCAWR